MAELAFEYLALKLEGVRGVAEAAPTHYLPLAGTLTPSRDFYRPNESRGTLAEYYRSKAVRQGSAWTAEGGADPNYAPLLFNLFIKGGVAAPTTPADAVLSRLWTFAPTLTADNLKSATFWFGDPNVQIWNAAYCMGNELAISADASGTDGATMTVSGAGQFPAKVADPTLPAQVIGDLLIPGAMQIWLDTDEDIGTTSLEGRVVSADFSVNNNLGYKYLAQGPGSNLSFSRVGRGKRHAESVVVVELLDMAEYDLWANGSPIKMRVRLNGDLIESVDDTDFYSYIEWDIYGPMDAFAWGDNASTNRTMSFTVMSELNASAVVAGYDYRLRVQNARTTL
jgi:hypothetical protein